MDDTGYRRHSALLKQVAKKLKHYVDVKRLEDGFDLSQADLPRLSHPSLKTRPAFQYPGLLDKPVKFQYKSIGVRKKIAQLHQVTFDKFVEKHVEPRRWNQVRHGIEDAMAEHNFLASCLPECYYVQPSALLGQRRVKTLVNLPRSPRSRKIKGGRPLLRSVPSERVPPTELKRLVDNAALVMLSAEIQHKRGGAPRENEPPYMVARNGKKLRSKSALPFHDYPVHSNRQQFIETIDSVDLQTSASFAHELHPHRWTPSPRARVINQSAALSRDLMPVRLPQAPSYNNNDADADDEYASDYDEENGTVNHSSSSSESAESALGDDKTTSISMGPSGIGHDFRGNATHPTPPPMQSSPSTPRSHAYNSARSTSPPTIRDSGFNTTANPSAISFGTSYAHVTHGMQDVSVQTPAQLLTGYKPENHLLSSGMTTDYAVYVRTGDRVGAGTTAQVFLVLFGVNGYTVPIELNKSMTNNVKFQKGHEDKFIVSSFNVGPISHITIGHRETHPRFSWYVTNVTVYDQHAHRIYFFPCDQWFSVHEEDGMTVRTLKPVDAAKAKLDQESLDVKARAYQQRKITDQQKLTVSNDGGLPDEKKTKHHDDNTRKKRFRKTQISAPPNVDFGDSVSTHGRVEEEQDEEEGYFNDAEEEKSPNTTPKFRVPEHLQKPPSPSSSSDGEEENEQTTEPVQHINAPGMGVVQSEMYKFPTEEPRSGRTSLSVGAATPPIIDRTKRPPRSLLSDEDESKTAYTSTPNGKHNQLKTSPKNSPTIHQIVAANDTRALRELLLLNPGLIEETIGHGYTPLLWAVTHGATECVKCLMDNDCDVLIFTNDGTSASHLAVQYNRIDILKMLLERDPQLVNVRSKVTNRTPLHTAAECGNLGAASLLIDCGAEMNCRDSQGNTPVHLAKKQGHDRMVGTLCALDSKSSIAGQHSDIGTPSPVQTSTPVKAAGIKVDDFTRDDVRRTANRLKFEDERSIERESEQVDIETHPSDVEGHLGTGTSGRTRRVPPSSSISSSQSTLVSIDPETYEVLDKWIVHTVTSRYHTFDPKISIFLMLFGQTGERETNWVKLRDKQKKGVFKPGATDEFCIRCMPVGYIERIAILHEPETGIQWFIESITLTSLQRPAEKYQFDCRQRLNDTEDKRLYLEIEPFNVQRPTSPARRNVLKHLADQAPKNTAQSDQYAGHPEATIEQQVEIEPVVLEAARKEETPIVKQVPKGVVSTSLQADVRSICSICQHDTTNCSCSTSCSSGSDSSYSSSDSSCGSESDDDNLPNEINASERAKSARIRRSLPGGGVHRESAFHRDQDDKGSLGGVD